MKQFLVAVLFVAAFCVPCLGAVIAVTDAADLVAEMAEHGKGNEYVLADGTYAQAIGISGDWVATEAAPTIFRAENPGMVVFDPPLSTNTGVETGTSPPPEWMEFRDLKFTGAYEGLRVYSGKHITVKRCTAYLCGNQGMSFHHNEWLLVEDCIFYSNGTVDSMYRHRHGIYVSGDHLTVRNCQSYNNTGYGIHCYDSGHDCSYTNNICIGNYLGMISATGVSTTERLRPGNGNYAGTNILLGNTMGLQMCFGAFDRIQNNVITRNLRVDQPAIDHPEWNLVPATNYSISWSYGTLARVGRLHNVVSGTESPVVPSGLEIEE